MQNQGSLPSEWLCWLAQNVMLGVPNERLLEAAAASGLDSNDVEAALRELRKSAAVQAGHYIARRLNKLETILDILSQLRAVSPQLATLERCSGLCPADFFERYYALNRPVVITGAINHWPALSKWTPDYFRETHGSAVVEVTMRRKSDANYEVNLHNHMQLIPLSTFVDMVLSGGETNDYYLVASNRVLERQLSSIASDIGPLEGYLNPHDSDGKMFLWFGPGGTVTPLHHDDANVFLVQLYGTKRVRLIPATQISKVYNSHGVFSDVDLESPDYTAHPAFRHAAVTDVVINPGDMLFIPVGWWHHVRALTISISVTMEHFTAPNRYRWPVGRFSC